MKLCCTILIVFLFFVEISSIKVFLVGGGANQNSTQVYGALAQVVTSRPPQPKKCNDNWDSTSCPRIAIVTSAAQNEATGNQAYSDDTSLMSYLTLMHNYGMSPKHVTVHIDNYKTDSNVSTPRGKANLQIIMQADVIFFNGGDQARHIRSWLNDDGTPNALLIAVRTRAISDELICSGTSAGSMIWTNQTFGGGSSFGTLYFKNLVGLAPKQVSDGGVNGTALFDNRNGTKSLQYSENAGKMPSFGFLNFTTDTHFNARGRLGRLVPVLIDLKDKFGFGVDENTSLYYENGIGTVFGWNGVTFCDIQNAVYSPQTYFSIKNVTVHYLTEGDRFDFRTKKVTSNKTLITNPVYTNPTDSNNILAAYEASLLQTRVVDQKSIYNLGKTRTPSGFPKNTPTFELQFSRNTNTKGYYGNKKYTVDSIVVDFAYGTNNLITDQ